jgi:hypothetical protein
MEAEAVFWMVLLATSVAAVVWAAVTTGVYWRRKRTESLPAMVTVATLLFVLSSASYALHIVIGYPAQGQRDTLAAVGVALSFLAALAGASSGPYFAVRYLLGGLGIALLWYLRGDVSLAQ